MNICSNMLLMSQVLRNNVNLSNQIVSNYKKKKFDEVVDKNKNNVKNLHNNGKMGGIYFNG